MVQTFAVLAASLQFRTLPPMPPGGATQTGSSSSSNKGYTAEPELLRTPAVDVLIHRKPQVLQVSDLAKVQASPHVCCTVTRTLRSAARLKDMLAARSACFVSACSFLMWRGLGCMPASECTGRCWICQMPDDARLSTRSFRQLTAGQMHHPVWAMGYVPGYVTYSQACGATLQVLDDVRYDRIAAVRAAAAAALAEFSSLPDPPPRHDVEPPEGDASPTGSPDRAGKVSRNAPARQSKHAGSRLRQPGAVYITAGKR